MDFKLITRRTLQTNTFHAKLPIWRAERRIHIFECVCHTNATSPPFHPLTVLNTANGTISSTVPMAGPEYDGRRQSRTTTGYGRTYACVKALVRTTTTTSRWRRRRVRMAFDRTRRTFLPHAREWETLWCGYSLFYWHPGTYLCASTEAIYTNYFVLVHFAHKRTHTHKERSADMRRVHYADKTSSHRNHTRAPRQTRTHIHISSVINFPQFATYSRSRNVHWVCI